MLGGVNDSLEEAAELAEWTRGLLVHVNLIPFNPYRRRPTPHRHAARPPPRVRPALKDAGVTTTTRYSMGQDIEAACGQLVQQGNRDLARSYAKLREADCCGPRVE